MNEFWVRKIGVIAAEVLAVDAPGSVIGLTSKGVFLRIGDRILFLTSTDYASPFNLTLAQLDHAMDELRPGDKFEVNSRVLIFPEVWMTVDTRRSEVWIPSPPVSIKTTLDWQLKRAGSWIQILNSKDPGKGYLFLAEDSQGGTSDGEHLKTRTLVGELIGGFKGGDFHQFLEGAFSLIGSGSGLTPSGDDLLAGFFLYHFRYDQAASKNRDFLRDWHSEVVKMAFQRTTTISANRLEATGRGWSEELFLHLLDALFDPLIILSEEFFSILLNFGHSSGVDTLMGIYFALQSMTQGDN